MKIKTILFDLDGTLIDSLPLIQSTYEKVFQEMEIPWYNGEVMKCIGLPLVEIGKKFAGEERHRDFFRLYQQHYAIEHDAKTKAYPGTLSMLENLRQRGVRMGVVTSKSNHVALRSTRFLGFDRYIEVLIGADDVTRHKPQPDPILTALQQMQVPQAGAAYIGDSPFDLMSAKAAGVTAIGVSWGMAEASKLLRFEPDHLLHQWEDLIGVLEDK
ncbi:HAD-IA family hydrolase [Desulfotomaculum sp. 1211_IL3151]|uniref:HAD-IA family hydrolase n=1 Tax=Desulfotomaculum sp. 1211_IL3151 TaxID=3084055 RepID=UPI002FD88570